MNGSCSGHTAGNYLYVSFRKAFANKTPDSPSKIKIHTSAFDPYERRKKNPDT
jgi:hypothetical protein